MSITSIPPAVQPAPQPAGLAEPARFTAPPRISERHPWLFPWAVRAHRVRRRMQWLLEDEMVLQRNCALVKYLAGRGADPRRRRAGLV